MLTVCVYRVHYLIFVAVGTNIKLRSTLSKAKYSSESAVCHYTNEVSSFVFPICHRLENLYYCCTVY